MNIKIDVDGVIRNINETMCKLYNELFNEHLVVNDIYDYNVEKAFSKIKEKIGMTAVDYFFSWEAKEVFLHSNPYDGVREAIQKLRDAGHKVVIVTWQFDLQNKYYTLMFFEKNKIPYDNICFTRDKWMIQGDWLIDDNPEFIMDERDKSRKIMINMPYNKNCDFSCTRADNLQEAVNIILEKNMTENELMIGDYLYWGKDKIVKVQMLRKYGDNLGIDVVYNDSVNLYFCTDNDDIYSNSINELKPIPLTQEILEKNGFTKESRIGNGEPLEYCVLVDGLWIDIRGESYFEGKLEYIHQLQHALRMCGVEKEIEL